MLADRIIFVCIVVFAGLYFYATSQIPALEIGDPLGPKAFPDLLGVGLLIAAGLLLLEMRRGTAPQPSATDDDGSRLHYVVIACVIGWTLAYFFAFEPLGYLVATTLYLLGLMAYFNRGRWLANVLTPVLFCAGSYLLFTRVLGVNLARGVLPF